MVGLLSLCATTLLTPEMLESVPRAVERFRRRIARIPELHHMLPHLEQPSADGSFLLSLLDETKLRRVLGHLLDEAEFFSPHGVRSLSKYHLANPYRLTVQGDTREVKYLPAESDSWMFGGNSNWRGPVWFPVNVLIFRALIATYRYYGDAFTIECPTGSGNQMTLYEIAQELRLRLTGIFRRDKDGRRPVFGESHTFQYDPLWRDHILFYEYFDGDTGAGLGASHQTGWTGLVASLIYAQRLAKEHGWHPQTAVTAMAPA
jgi:hypothetical protein